MFSRNVAGSFRVSSLAFAAHNDMAVNLPYLQSPLYMLYLRQMVEPVFVSVCLGRSPVWLGDPV